MPPDPRPDAGLFLVNEPPRLVRGTWRDLGETWTHRELLRALVGRELRSRYKGTHLGWVWALIRPLVMLLVYGLGVGVFLGAGEVIPQFVVYLYVGLLAWGLFSSIVSSCVSSVTANGPLVAKSRFPRLLLPLAATIAALVDFVLQASVLVVGYFLVGGFPSARDLMWLPPALATLVLLALGVGLVLAAVNVYLRDVEFFTDVALQVGFWLVPVVYTYGQVVRGFERFGWAADVATQVYLLNPMVTVLLSFHRALWPAYAHPDAAGLVFSGPLHVALAIVGGASIIVAWVGSRVYARLARNFGQEF